MALSPAEAAQLSALMAKQAEPEPEPAAPVVVVVEAPEIEVEAPEMETAAPESESDLVIAGAVAQTMVIDAQAEADIRRMTAAHTLDQAARADEVEPLDVIEDPIDVIDEILGTVEDALPEPDVSPISGHWFYRPLGRR